MAGTMHRMWNFSDRFPLTREQPGSGPGAAAADEGAAQPEARGDQLDFGVLADHAPVMIWQAGPDGACQFFNRTWLDFTGRKLADELGNGWTASLHPDDFAGCMGSFHQALERREAFSMEFRLRRRDGEYRWILNNAVPYVEQGAFRGFLGSCSDITDRKQFEVSQMALINELNHRVKNSLFTVQSLVRQSVRSAADLAEAEQLIYSRVTALAKIHELLSASQWQGCDLATLVTVLAEPFGRGRITAFGPPMKIRAGICQAIGLAIHELALNAQRFGALSHETGSVEIAWEEVPDGQGAAPTSLRLAWREINGPAVTAPDKQGFGRLFLERILPNDTDGSAVLDFPQTGAVCEILFPLK